MQPDHTPPRGRRHGPLDDLPAKRIDRALVTLRRLQRHWRDGTPLLFDIESPTAEAARDLRAAGLLTLRRRGDQLCAVPTERPAEEGGST